MHSGAGWMSRSTGAPVACYRWGAPMQGELPPGGSGREWLAPCTSAPLHPAPPPPLVDGHRLVPQGAGGVWVQEPSR